MFDFYETSTETDKFNKDKFNVTVIIQSNNIHSKYSFQLKRSSFFSDAFSPASSLYFVLQLRKTKTFNENLISPLKPFETRFFMKPTE